MAHTVLIVDDSGLMRNTIRQIIAVDPELEVVGEAADGMVALEKMRALKPNVVLLDIEMPKLDGLAVPEARAPDQLGEGDHSFLAGTARLTPGAGGAPHRGR